MKYLQLQTIFQDKYETGLKNAGLEDYKLPTETIYNYLHEAEIEIVDKLAKSKQYNYLKNFTTTSDLDVNAHVNISNVYYATQPVDFMHYLKSITVGTFATFSGDIQGVVENEMIDPAQAGLFYKTPYNNPLFRNPKVFIESTSTADPKKVVLIVDSYTLPYGGGDGALKLTYIKAPEFPQAQNESMIDIAYVNTVVELAVNAALSYVIAGGVTNSRERRQNTQREQE